MPKTTVLKLRLQDEIDYKFIGQCLQAYFSDVEFPLGTKIYPYTLSVNIHNGMYNNSEWSSDPLEVLPNISEILTTLGDSSPDKLNLSKIVGQDIIYAEHKYRVVDITLSADRKPEPEDWVMDLRRPDIDALEVSINPYLEPWRLALTSQIRKYIKDKNDKKYMVTRWRRLK